MRCQAIVFALGLFVIGGSTADGLFKGKKGGSSGAGFGWLSSLTEGKEQARASGKPMMVVLRCVP